MHIAYAMGATPIPSDTRMGTSYYPILIGWDRRYPWELPPTAPLAAHVDPPGAARGSMSNDNFDAFANSAQGIQTDGSISQFAAGSALEL